MAENELSETGLEVKTKRSELDVTTPEFKPLHMTSKPIIQDNNSVPKEKDGNGLEKNGQKRIQTAPIDATDGNSKKSRINTPEDSNAEAGKADGDVTDFNKTGDEDEMDQNSDTEEFYLTVNNLPTDWTYVQIKDYLDLECGHVDEMEMLKHRRSKNCAIRLTFQNIDDCVEVFKKLENKFIQDKKLKVKISDTYTTFPTGAIVPNTVKESLIKQCSISNEVIAVTRWRPDLDSWDTDPEGLYGLRPEFLKALGIEPPLNKVVHVTNFRCDKNDLREVMAMAGNVLMCCVVATSYKKYAKVMFSHPLEAVQAISMLNGQLFYGTPLKITIDKNPADSVVLPKGLANIGQGLGIKARPIHNIVQQYHRYASKQTSLINPIVFSEIDFSGDYINNIKEANPEETEKSIKEFLSSRPGCNILNPTVPFKVKNIDQLECPDSSMDARDLSTAETATESPYQNETKKGAETTPNSPLVRPSAMQKPLSMAGPRGPVFSPGNNPQGFHTFRPRVPYTPPPIQRPPFQQPRSLYPPPANRLSVKFENLPPSTSFKLLCDLLAQCGQVLLVQLTIPGCAVATYGLPSHAERCVRCLNGRKVDGFTISATLA